MYRKAQGLGRFVGRAAFLGWLCATHASVHAVENGAPEKAGSWPQVVALVDRGTPGAGVFGTELKGIFCTGTLIRPNLVLTAAHCVTDRASEQARADLPTQVGIYRGEGRLNYLGAVPAQVRVKKALVHPDSGHGTDLALLAIDAPLAGLRPLSLHAAPATLNQEVQSVGFGEVHPQESRNTMGQKSTARRRLDLPDPKEICSVRAGIKTPSSAGDSGGPALVSGTSGQAEVIGVLTGFRTKQRDGRAIETDCWIPVAAHRAWIDRSIAELEAASSAKP